MKKLINTSLIYAILAMIMGVFYREFTRILGFTGKTTLSVTHLHLFVMGTVVFLILVLFEKQFNITQNKLFKGFYITYNVGLIFMVAMFTVRGILTVMTIPSVEKAKIIPINELSEFVYKNGLNATDIPNDMISGISGIAHIIMGTGIILLLVLIKRSIIQKSSANN